MSVLESLHQAHVYRRRVFASRVVPDDGINMRNGWPVRMLRQAPLSPPPDPPPLVIPPCTCPWCGANTLDAAAKIILTAALIQRVTAQFYNVTRTEMLSPRRQQHLIRPRHVAMYLTKTMTGLSLPDIGRRFGGRDHTTALSAVRKIERLLTTDERLRDEVELLTARLREAVA